MFVKSTHVPSQDFLLRNKHPAPLFPALEKDVDQNGSLKFSPFINQKFPLIFDSSAGIPFRVRCVKQISFELLYSIVFICIFAT